MKKVKHVYPTREIAHLWAHQSQESARNPQGNFSFRKNELISYSTTIATLVKVKKETVVLLADRSWSNTTSKHQSLASAATNHLQRFRVPEYIPNYQGKINHKANLQSYKTKIEALEKQFLKSRNNAARIYSQLSSLVINAKCYAQAFGLITKFDISIDKETAKNIIDKGDELCKKYEEKREARWEAWNKEELKKEEQRLLEAPENFEAWKNGEETLYKIPLSFFKGKAYGRVKNNNLQTTLSANVPIEHIQRVSALVRKIIERGEEFIPNGHTIHLGHYQLDKIDKDGTVHCGCHHFDKTEVLRILDICNK